jgi:hypothetical protein
MSHATLLATLLLLANYVIHAQAYLLIALNARR